MGVSSSFATAALSVIVVFKLALLSKTSGNAVFAADIGPATGRVGDTDVKGGCALDDVAAVPPLGTVDGQ